MIGHMLGRSVTRLLASAVVVSVTALLPSAVSAASSSALEGRLDVAELSERAASYAFAYSNHRAEALDRAEDLAREGQQAEREEEQRLAALAVTRAAERARIATTVPPTTVPPTTVPPTTVLCHQRLCPQQSPHPPRRLFLLVGQLQNSGRRCGIVSLGAAMTR